MQTFRYLCLTAVLVFATGLTTMTGCAALAPALNVLSTAITDSDQALRIIEAAFNAFQVGHPVSQEDRKAFASLMATAYQTLNTGTRAVSDAKQINQGDLDLAFKDFKVAYSELHSFLKQRGITPVGSGLVGVGTAGGDDFQAPRLLSLELKK